MRKICFFALILCVMLNTNVLASNLKIVAEDEERMTVHIVSDFDFSALSFELEYNKSALEFESNKFSEALGSAIPMINPSYSENSIKVSVLSTDKLSSGEICMISFQKRTQTFKDSGLKLKNIAAADKDGNIIEVNKSENQPIEEESSGTSLVGSSGGLQAVLPNGTKDNFTVGSSQSSVDSANSLQTTAKEFKFLDVTEEDWYYEAVKFAFDEGITSGVSEKNYAPRDFVTRGQFITMLCRANKIEEMSGDNFSDCGNTWFTGYLAAAKQLGISKGVGENMFAPEKEITREEVVALIYNYLKSKGEVSSKRGNTTFADSDDISDWAKDGVVYASSVGFINGKENNMFDPQGKTTRAELAQIFFNLLNK